MKTKLILLYLLLSSVWALSQVSELDNSGSLPGNYLGWDNTTTFPLAIRHNRIDQPIGMFTNNFQRLRINAGNANPTINTFPVSTAGFVAISTDPGFYTGVGPFSLLHLAGQLGTQQLTFRPWMQIGLSITGNGDGMYLGQRIINNTVDLTEAALCWGDNFGASGGPDHMVFRFLRSYDSFAPDNTNPSSMLGLQVARMIGSNGGRVGIGNTFGT